MARDDATQTRLIRLDHADLADGGRAHLLMASAAGKASAIALVRDAGRTAFSLARGLLTSEALGIPTANLLRHLSNETLREQEFRRLGVFALGAANRLQSHLWTVCRVLQGEHIHIRDLGEPSNHPSPHSVLGLSRDPRGETHPPPFLLRVPPNRIVPSPEDAGLATGTTLPLTLEGDEIDGLRAWLDALREDFQPGHGLALGVGSWSPGVVAHLAAPGRIGEWRRQAAALYPAFARTLAHDAGLRALVDTGEPYEEALLALIRRAVVGPNGDPLADPSVLGLTLAKLRRMRAYRRPLFKEGVDGFQPSLALVNALPLALVPDTPEGWDNLVAKGSHLIRDVRQGGMDLGTALRGVPRGWDLPSLWPEHPDQDLQTVLLGLHDMAERFSETLLQPAYDGRLPDRIHFLSVANHLLFGGDSVARMARRQREWHADLPRMSPVLSSGVLMTWPALFEPFRHGAVTVRCLTTSHELDAEGGDGPDEQGMAGLAHCVGGYRAACGEGRSHVASVTGPGPDGVPERLATAELEIHQGRFSLRQLRARANAAPPPAAVEALDALLAALNDERHPHDPIAAQVRPPMPLADEARLDLEAVLAVWRPHMPKAIRADGIEPFRDLLRLRIETLVSRGSKR